MKQFILANTFKATGDVSTLVNGNVGFVVKGTTTITNVAANLKNECNLVCKEGEYVNHIPFYNNKFRFEETPYSAGVLSKATITLKNNYNKGVYTLIVVKKGVQFNEQNKWSVSTYVAKDGTTAANLAEELHKQLNKISFVKATISTATITVEPLDKNVEIKVIAADSFAQADVTIEHTSFKPVINDAAQIKDLYEKCAADRGINYTYEDANIYPNMPFNPLKGSDSADTGFTVFTLRFAEPRQTKTTDEVINQVVHVAFPTSAASAITDFKAVLVAFTDLNSGTETTASEEPLSLD